MTGSFDRECMARAIRLAHEGLYTTDPNPRVGCVIARAAADAGSDGHGGEIVGEGFHLRAGEPHAEINAMRAAGPQVRGATAYLTLEPCSHHGRTPPCAGALIAAGVARVVVATADPNPLVAGSGLAQLRAAGITVETGLMAAEAEVLNPGFFSRMRRGRPWVRIKVAASLDGRTALANGRSQWITSEAARRDGQRLRARASAILTGIGTVLADDPRLTVRLPTSMTTAVRQPLRVVVDTQLRTPVTARMLKEPGSTLVVCASSEVAGTAARLVEAGAEVHSLPGKDGHVDLAALMIHLAQREINELHVEAGERLNGALLAAGLVDEIVIYLAPMLLGSGARGLFALPVMTSLEEHIGLTIREIRAVGPDWRILARPATAHAAT